MKTQNLSSRKRLAVQALIAALAALVVLGVVLARNGKQSDALSHVNKGALIEQREGKNRAEDDETRRKWRGCMKRLNGKAQLGNVEKLKETIDDDAIVAYADQSGEFCEFQREDAVNLGAMRFRRKALTKKGMLKGDLFGDKGVIARVDLDTCEVTNVYKVTAQGNIDSPPTNEVNERVLEGAEAVKPEEEPGAALPTAMADIAFGTHPSLTAGFPFTARVGNGCSGVIISKFFVVTSKHCVNGAAHNSVQIMAGTNKPWVATNRQIRQSVKIWRHGQEDIALIRVSPGWTYTKYVRRVSRFMGYKMDGLRVYAAGFGAESKPSVSNVRRLKWATMYTKSDSWCDNHHKGFAVGKEVCCQGGTGNTCAGDSGGPLVYSRYAKWNLLGINSWSVTSCSAKQSNVDVFESMVYLRNWVLTTMGQNYGWSNAVVHSTICTQARWKKIGCGKWTQDRTLVVSC